MASPIGSEGSFRIARDEEGSSIDIHITEQAGVKAENLSLSTWGASFVLANLLHKLKIPSVSEHSLENGGQRRQPIALELGAGTGLVGISAAALWKINVILTDLPSILPALLANISLNKRLLDRSGSLASCASLDWAHPAEVRSFPDSTPNIVSGITKADIILAADTIYSDEHPELLSRTIATWLAPGPHSRVVLCYPLRMAYIEHIREFWELMEAAGMECIEEGRETGDENWNEVAHTPYEWCVWRNRI